MEDIKSTNMVLIPENEISRAAGINIDQRTNGPIVEESRQTSLDGVFACGNVLQVHDLVDFVSEEGELAGIGAAQYVHNQFNKGVTHITVNGEGISYVIPQQINVKNIAEKIRLYMRVKDIYTKKIIKAYLNKKVIASHKEIKFVPAEMVSFVINKQDLLNNPGKEIVIQVEAAT